MIKTLGEESREQEWQKLRREVSEYSGTSMDDRMEALRKSVAHLDGSVRAMEATFQYLNKEISKLVTRSEFNPIMYIVYGICFSIITGGVFFALSKALLK